MFDSAGPWQSAICEFPLARGERGRSAMTSRNGPFSLAAGFQGNQSMDSEGRPRFRFGVGRVFGGGEINRLGVEEDGAFSGGWIGFELDYSRKF